MHSLVLIFHAMLSDNYFNDMADGVIEGTNISHLTFKSIMDFIYIGHRPLQIDETYDILPIVDFYGLQSLKHICMYMIDKRDLVIERVAHVYEFVERYDLELLMHACILFILEFREQIRSLPLCRTLVERNNFGVVANPLEWPQI